MDDDKSCARGSQAMELRPGERQELDQLERCRDDSSERLGGGARNDEAPRKKPNAFIGFLKALPLRVKAVLALAVVVIAVLVFGVVLPLAFDNDETQYLTESTLKEAVNVQTLATVDYTYKGIAEKTGKILWADTVEYRVKYEAHFRAGYDMSAVEFAIDEGTHTVTATLPPVQIDEPVPDENKFSFLPENATADIKEVLALCTEDALNEFDQAEIQREASRNMEAVIEALTTPILKDEWTLKFAEQPTTVAEEAQDETE